MCSGVVHLSYSEPVVLDVSCDFVKIIAYANKQNELACEATAVVSKSGTSLLFYVSVGNASNLSTTWVSLASDGMTLRYEANDTLLYGTYIGYVY